MTSNGYYANRAEALAEAHHRARYFHAQALSAERAGRHALASEYRVAAEASRASAERLEALG